MRQAILVLLLLSLPAVAKDKHAPLPEKLLSAKTVYIVNQGAKAEVYDRVFDELTKWNRFAIVQDRSKADLVFSIGSSVSSSGRVVDDRVQSNHYTSLTVSDPSTQEVLWSDVRAWGMFKSAGREIIRNLRDRFDEQQATN